MYIVLRTPFSGSSPTDFDKNLIMGTKIPPERHQQERKVVVMVAVSQTWEGAHVKQHHAQMASQT
mgnify:CR=1 FL=1